MSRWMLFVDGENLTIRGQEIARNRSSDYELTQGDLYERDVFLWFARIPPTSSWVPGSWAIYQHKGIRAHYYTSVTGDDPKILAVRESLRNIGFQPEVFKKDSQQVKAKGVDVALTKDMLSHAFLHNYDAAVLIAGDGDYVPLIREVQRLGKLVFVAFFLSNGMHRELRLAAAGIHDLMGIFEQSWRRSSR